MYLAVLPSYREACIRHLRRDFGNSLELYVADAHLDPSVKTGIERSLYQDTGIFRIASAVFVQHRYLMRALRAENLIVDLNPRSISAWILLVGRSINRRTRTLVWGHLYPRAGRDSLTSVARRIMRRLANGTISYTYQHRDAALQDLPDQRVWVAPNALYDSSKMLVSRQNSERNSVIYVGRLASSKKVQLLVNAYRLVAIRNPKINLILVGDGAEAEALRQMASAYGLEHEIEFTGWINDVSQLQRLYGRSFCSVSPGFAGLGLTQSLGFGVPMVISETEEHSPEIELATSDCSKWFETDSPESLADAILKFWDDRYSLPLEEVAERTRNSYSAEAMAEGIKSALLDHRQLENYDK